MVLNLILINEIIKSKKSYYKDKNNNKYIFENLIIDLKKMKLQEKK